MNQTFSAERRGWCICVFLCVYNRITFSYLSQAQAKTFDDKWCLVLPVFLGKWPVSHTEDAVVSARLCGCGAKTKALRCHIDPALKVTVITPIHRETPVCTLEIHILSERCILSASLFQHCFLMALAWNWVCQKIRYVVH